MKHIGGRGDLRLARRLLVRELIWMKPPKRWGNQAVRQRLSAYVLLPGRPTPETLPCRSRPLKSKMPQTSFPQQFLKLICPKEINLAGRKRLWKPTCLESRLNHSKTRRWAWRIRGWRIWEGEAHCTCVWALTIGSLRTQLAVDLCDTGVCAVDMLFSLLI